MTCKPCSEIIFIWHVTLVTLATLRTASVQNQSGQVPTLPNIITAAVEQASLDMFIITRPGQTQQLMPVFVWRRARAIRAGWRPLIRCVTQYECEHREHRFECKVRLDGLLVTALRDNQRRRSSQEKTKRT